MFRSFEKEVIRTLVGDALGRGLLERVLAATEIEEDWSPIGYFLTVKDSSLPRERAVFHDPPGIIGAGDGAHVGFVVFVENGELTLECFRWDGSDDRLPTSFRDTGVVLQVKHVPTLRKP